MKWRIWLLSFAFTLISVLLFAIVSTQVYYNSSIADSKEYLSVYMNEYSSEYSLDNEGAMEFSHKLNGARVTFMDPQGNVLGDSAKDNLENHADREEIKDAIFEGEGFAVRNSSSLGQNMIYYCKNFEGKFLVRIAIFTDSTWAIFVSILPIILQFSIIMIALSILLAFLATHFILNPVKKLARDAGNSKTIESKYSELEPVVNILNERNRNIAKQMDEIKAEKELVEKARISKDEFISNITHEMNTPLTSIRGYAELLDDGKMSEEQKKVAYATILNQSERLTSLIACIINYNKIESDDTPLYEVDFSSLAREMIYALKPEANKRNITIIEKIDDNVMVLSRHERLSEIFGNLVRNAIKYNKDGGSIMVTLNYQGLIIEDTGVGIAEENLDKVFSRFFTVDRSKGGKNGGFGLGLAVVKKICQKQNWKIGVESTINEGSKFFVEF